MPSPFAPRALLQGPHPAAAQGQRQAVRMSLAGFCVVVVMVTLLVVTEGAQRRAATAAAHAAALRDARALGGLHWWSRWERRLKEQEERVGQWRERQRRVVFRETEAEEAMVAARAGAAVAAEGLPSARVSSLLAAKVAAGEDAARSAASSRVAALLSRARARQSSLAAEAS